MTLFNKKPNLTLSVILSFRNEEAVLPELITRLRAVLHNECPNAYELVFVNDASTDDSLAVLKKEAARHQDIKIITLSRRFGIPASIMAGMQHACGDAVVYMDADLQDPPEVIPVLLKEWRNGADVVHTVRTKREGEPVLKVWLTHWAYRFINMFSSITLIVDAGDFKLLSRRVVNECVRLNEKDAYIKGLVSWAGFKQVSVQYTRERRFAGKTHFSLFRSINPVRTFISGITSFSSWPLYMILFIGLVLLLCALVAAGVLSVKVCAGGVLPVVLSVSVIICGLGGLQLVALGIVALYIGRIYKEVKGRPLYIVQEMVGFEGTPKKLQNRCESQRTQRIRKEVKSPPPRLSHSP